MKKVTAFIQPFMLPHVLDGLHAIEGFPGATTSEGQGVGAALHRTTTIIRHTPMPSTRSAR